MESSNKTTPKTIRELNQKVWYRSLKVIYCVAFLPAAGFAIFLTYAIVQPTAVERRTDFDKTAIICNFGNKGTFYDKDMSADFQATALRHIVGFMPSKDKIAIQIQCGLNEQMVVQILIDEFKKEGSGVTLTSNKIQEWIDNGATFPEAFLAAQTVDSHFAAGTQRLNAYAIANDQPSGNDSAFIARALKAAYGIVDPMSLPESDKETQAVISYDAFCSSSSSESPLVKNRENVIHIFDTRQACKNIGGGWGWFCLYSLIAIAIILALFELGRRGFYYIAFGNLFPPK